MFTAEIKINGTMIGHIYGRNVGDDAVTGKTIYDVDFYQPDKPRLERLVILHDENDGINMLIVDVLVEADKMFSRDGC